MTNNPIVPGDNDSAPDPDLPNPTSGPGPTLPKYGEYASPPSQARHNAQFPSAQQDVGGSYPPAPQNVGGSYPPQYPGQYPAAPANPQYPQNPPYVGGQYPAAPANPQYPQNPPYVGGQYPLAPANPPYPQNPPYSQAPQNPPYPQYAAGSYPQYGEQSSNAGLNFGGTWYPQVAQGTKVWTWAVWVLVALPLLGLLVLIPVDDLLTTAAKSVSVQKYSDAYNAATVAASLDLLAIIAISAMLWIAGVILAAVDYRILGRLGYQRRFHWAWAFLSVAVYVIGRSVMVNRQARRGLAIVWIYLALIVLVSVIAMSVVFMDAARLAIEYPALTAIRQ